MKLRPLALTWIWLAAVSCNSLPSCGRQARELAPTAEAKAVTAAPDASCERCRTQLCAASDGQSANLYAGCFKAPDPKLVPHADASFARDCQAVVACAYAHDCAYDPALGPVHCYCGSRAVDECLKDGPAPDAACVEEWKAATRTTKNAEILERFSLIDFPSGWAFGLLECDRDRCGPKSAVGRCTP